MKFSRLSLNELESLEKEFIEFLAVHGIDSEYWITLKKDNSTKANELIDIFSDVVWQKSIDKVAFLEHRSSNSIKLFKCDKDTIELIGIDGDVALLDKGNLTSSTEKKYSIYQHKKKYSPNRDLELYRMIKTGCTLTNDHLFNSAKKWL